MSIKFKATGFEEGLADFRRFAQNFDQVVDKELQTWGDESVDYLKSNLLSNGFDLQPKKRDDGKPPLIDTETYVKSYHARAANMVLDIVAEGMNTFMSNEDLAEILEYGVTGLIPARPHIRLLARWMVNRIPVLGERIVRGLSRHT